MSEERDDGIDPALGTALGPFGGLVGGRASELLRAVFSRFGRSLVFWKALVENFLTRSREILFLDPKSVFRHGMENRA